MRNRGPRESRRLSGSFSSLSFVTTALWRYVADMTISLNNFLTSQPDSRNSTASQSSNSGCDGNSPETPKSPADRTRPVPNNSLQNRFTVTRAVSGCSGRSSHLRKPKPIVRQVGREGGQHRGRARRHLILALIVLAAVEDERDRRFGLLLHHVADRAAGLNVGLLACEVVVLLRQFLILVVETREPPFVQAIDVGRAALFGRRCDDRRQRGPGQRCDFAIGQAASVHANVLNRSRPTAATFYFAGRS